MTSLRVLLALVLVALVATATSVRQPASAQGQTIKIGVLFDHTGPFSAAGSLNCYRGAKMIIDYINEKGVVLGKYKIVKVDADSQSKAEAAINEAERLLNVEKVDILAGVYSSAHAVPLAEKVDKQQKFLWITTAIADAVLKDRNLQYTFRPQPNGSLFGESTVQYVAANAQSKLKKGIKDVRAAIIYEDGPYGAHVLDSLLELALRIGRDVLHGRFAEEAAVGLGPEGVLQVAILQDGIGNRRRDPQELLLLVHLLGERDRVCARVHAGQDVDLLDVAQPLGLVHGSLGLRLTVAVYLHDLVLAEDAALLVDVVDNHLGAAVAVERSGRRERPGVIEEHADLDRLALSVRRLAQRGGGGDESNEDQRQQHAQRCHAERPPGRKGAPTLARLPGQNHPLLARPAHDRARRRHRPLDAEARREEATHLGLRHRERRAGATAADRKEAGQEPAARLQDRRDRVHVLPAPARIDRAIARVLPQPVERVDLVAAEREHIALLEGHVDAVALGQGPSGLEGGRREIESDDVVAVAGQQPRVVAAPAAGHGDASPRRRRRLEEMGE